MAASQNAVTETARASYPETAELDIQFLLIRHNNLQV